LIAEKMDRWFFCLFGMLIAAENTFVTMRDGVKLHTVIDQEFQKNNDSVVTIMDRSPYGTFSTELIATAFSFFTEMVALRQDMRGTGKSEGNFTIWHSGMKDSEDTMDWTAKQSWSNGDTYIVGASADGICAFEALKANSPHLKSMFIIWSTSEGHLPIYPGGAARQKLIEEWMKITIPKESDRCIAEVYANEDPRNDWWSNITVTPQEFAKVSYPVVFWAGWYDIFLPANLNAFEGVQKGGKPSIQGKSRIVIDPLGHCQAAGKYFTENTIEGRTAAPLYLAIYNFLQQPMPADLKAITFYIMGPYPHTKTTAGNYWTSLDDWPEPQLTKYFLAEKGQLVNESPSQSSTFNFTYDPSDPVPTNGGNNLFMACGPLDQRPQEEGKRKDVLTFTSAVLAEDVAVTGALIARLFVSSDAVDTDFTAKLTDVYPDGSSRLIQDGILRMRWRDPSKGVQQMHPDEIYPVDVSLWNTSYVFNKGHSIRFSVSSSNAPRFLPNPNNGLPISQKGEAIVAHNAVHAGGNHASHLLLPVVNLADLPKVDVHTIRPPVTADGRSIGRSKFDWENRMFDTGLLTGLLQHLPVNRV